MKVKFWGCRGSLPASHSGDQEHQKVRQLLHRMIDAKITSKDQIDGFVEELPFYLKSSYGTNTCCIQIIGGDEIVICDAGSGIRDLGKTLIAMGPDMPKVIHILMSHLHWDHIQGFPFFIPAYIQGVTINIYGCHDTIQDAFIRQQDVPTFPVQLRDMGSRINFTTLDKNEQYDIAGLQVSITEQPHPGLSYGYRFEKDQQVIVYSTDAEHADDCHDEDYPFLEFIRDADILIFDGQFSLADHLYTKQNWGHSSNLVGIEMAVRAQVKRLFLFHSDHTFNDESLENFLEDSRRYLEIYDAEAVLDIAIAYDGMLVDLDSET